MNLRIRTLTPLWTGDIERKSEKLRETSIIGSLRWWFETIVRGFGGNACDSVGEVARKCEFNVEEYKKGARPEELVCPVCYVFGTTGWSRRFRLEIDGKLNQLPLIIVKAYERGGHRGWFLGTKESGGLVGTSEVKVYGDSWIKDVLELFLNVSCFWGIGAKTQDGFGICKFEGQYDVDKAIKEIKDLISKFEQSQSSKLLPNMEDYFFVKITVEENINSNSNIIEVLNNKLFKDSDNRIGVEEFLQHIPEEYENKFYPTAPLIRYWLRSLFRNANDDLRHFLFGFVAKNVHKFCGGEVSKKRCKRCGKIVGKNEIEKKPKLILGDRKCEKMGSKIFVSHIYNVDNNKWEFKIWGYVPKVLPNNENREKVLQKLFSEIKENKNFANVLNLDRNSTDVEWYEVSKERSNISSTEELIGSILEVNKNE
jgi:CRISPR-associated protein Cmr1